MNKKSKNKIKQSALYVLHRLKKKKWDCIPTLGTGTQRSGKWITCWNNIKTKRKGRNIKWLRLIFLNVIILDSIEHKSQKLWIRFISEPDALLGDTKFSRHQKVIILTLISYTKIYAPEEVYGWLKNLSWKDVRTWLALRLYLDAFFLLVIRS